MTASTHTSAKALHSYSMSIHAGESLLHDLQKNLVALEKTRRAPLPAQTSWKQVAAEPAPKNDGGLLGEMFGPMLGGFLFDFLFGSMPVIQTMFETMGQSLGEIGHSASQAGMALVPAGNNSTTEAKTSTSFAQLERATRMNNMLRQARDTRKEAASQSVQTKMLQQMVMMLLMEMLDARRKETGEGKSGDSGQLAADPLRNPVKARFVQNRQSIACIRTLFARETVITEPQLPALRYA